MDRPQTNAADGDSARETRNLGEVSGTLIIEGRRLEFRWIGPWRSERPTLVFLHEGLGCVRMWKDFPDRLAAATGSSALIYSRAGYGWSDPGILPVPIDYHRREALDVLPAVLERTGVRRAVLVGHSDGGTIALLHAGLAPTKKIAAVVTIAAHVFNEDVTTYGIRKTKTQFLQKDLRRRLARYHHDNVDAAFWGWCDIWLSPAFAHWNVEDCLKGITCPVLAIQGEADEYGSKRQVEAIVGGVAGRAQACIMPGCAHAPHLEQPGETVTEVAAFLKANLDSSGI
jgi:pimeloyl-ACP methyl ester carboxylesterase